MLSRVAKVHLQTFRLSPAVRDMRLSTILRSKYFHSLYDLHALLCKLSVSSNSYNNSASDVDKLSHSNLGPENHIIAVFFRKVLMVLSCLLNLNSSMNAYVIRLLRCDSGD